MELLKRTSHIANLILLGVFCLFVHSAIFRNAGWGSYGWKTAAKTTELLTPEQTAVHHPNGFQNRFLLLLGMDSFSDRTDDLQYAFAQRKHPQSGAGRLRVLWVFSRCIPD
jgi:hypothetical protein